MTDRELILNYRDIVLSINSINENIEWNERHNLPVLDLLEQARSLKRSLIRFEELLRMIPNRRDRIIIRCRYVLGLGEQDTADYMNISRGTVSRICLSVLKDKS